MLSAQRFHVGITTIILNSVNHNRMLQHNNNGFMYRNASNQTAKSLENVEGKRILTTQSVSEKLLYKKTLQNMAEKVCGSQ